jgi:hypothetical protein
VRITLWPKGWTHLRPNGSQGYRQATITLSPRHLLQAGSKAALTMPECLLC